MDLTRENVVKVIRECLFIEGEPTDPRIEVDGIAHKFGFHPERLKDHEADIRSMLDQLPDAFKQSKGGGWTFLNACNNSKGEQWTDYHMDMESLFALGIGLGAAKWLMPKDMWSVLPGGMPYVQILDGVGTATA